MTSSAEFQPLGEREVTMKDVHLYFEHATPTPGNLSLSYEKQRARTMVSSSWAVYTELGTRCNTSKKNTQNSQNKLQNKPLPVSTFPHNKNKITFNELRQ